MGKIINNEAETEIKVEVVKKESFWKKNKDKIVNVGKLVLAFAGGVFVGWMTAPCVKAECISETKEPEDVIPFETEETE